MNIMARIVTIAALCVGFAPMVTAATVKVQLIKTDPKARKKPWSYQVRSKKNADSTVSSTRLKTFTRDTKASIDASNYENILRVYPNRTGAFGPNGQVLFKELNLTSSMLEPLKSPENGLALDKDINMTMLPVKDIKDLIADTGIKIRKINVAITRGFPMGLPWRVESFIGDKKYANASLAESEKEYKLSVPVIPADKELTIKVMKKNNKHKRLVFTSEQANKLTKLELNAHGQDVAGIATVTDL